MISVVMPYWKRPDVAKECLDLYAQHYGGMELEVIVVDDGSHDFEYEAPWVRIHKLPKKDVPMNPCTPLNAGVGIARGEVIVLTGPDIMHRVPVLQAMRTELFATGPLGYILAACWCEQSKEWHCHSSMVKDGMHPSGVKQPNGSGFHFCSMFHVELFEKCGGFDEEYRNGAYFDDPDFVNRLARVGAQFKIRDDLVVEHIRRGCYTNWPGGAADINQAIFKRKWG